jgi:hypothetical protein
MTHYAEWKVSCCDTLPWNSMRNGMNPYHNKYSPRSSETRHRQMRSARLASVGWGTSPRYPNYARILNKDPKSTEIN